jgi:hypothetical protein
MHHGVAWHGKGDKTIGTAWRQPWRQAFFVMLRPGVSDTRNERFWAEMGVLAFAVKCEKPREKRYFQ